MIGLSGYSKAVNIAVRVVVMLIMLAIWWWAVITPRLALSAEREAHAETRAVLEQTKASHADTLREISTLAAAASDEAHARAASFHAQMAEKDRAFQQEMFDAKAKSDAVAAELRAGTLQLRQWWQSPTVGCVADAAVPSQAAPDPHGAAEGAELRIASAGRIVGSGAEADAWIRSLQSELVATRTACGATVNP